MEQANLKGVLKKRAYQALALSKDTPEQRLLIAIIQQAIDDHDKPHCDPRSAARLLDSWYPSWRTDKAKIERYLRNPVAA